MQKMQESIITVNSYLLILDQISTNIGFRGKYQIHVFSLQFFTQYQFETKKIQYTNEIYLNCNKFNNILEVLLVKRPYYLLYFKLPHRILNFLDLTHSIVFIR